MKVGAERRSHPDSRDSSSAMSKSDGNATDDIPEQSQIQNNPREINKQDHRILVDARDVEEHGEDDDWGSSEAGAESGSLKSSRSLLGIFHTKNTTLLVSIILMLGFASAIAFTAIGLTGALRTENEEFVREASATAVRISDSFSLYANAASLIHARCRHRDFTRTDFRELYEYVVASDLEFKAMQFSPNITHEERPEAEAESRQFYAENYPHVNYQGFRGFNALNATTLEPRWNESFYFPIHYQEPVLGNEAAIDLDYYSSESRRRAVNALFEHKRPSMTDRLSLVKEAGQVSRCGDHGGPSFGIVLMHPGVPLSTDDPDADVWPRDFAAIVLCVPDLLTSSTVDHTRAVSVYIHDLSHPGEDDVFLGAAQLRSVTDALGNNESDKVVVHSSKSAATAITFLGEKNLDQLTHDNRRSYQEDIEVANRVWTVTVVDEEDRFNSSMLFVLLGGFLIVLASVFLAIWVRHNDQRTRNFNALQADAEQEKASLVLQSARQAAKTERELNDFIAHEVRNPVAAAMAATNFVKMELIKSSPLSTAETIDQAREDIGIIDQSLQFVNDLLRNMLDMHRAKSKQMQVTMAPTDLLHDVLEPVAGMLRRVRNNRVQILVDCPENMFVITDALRLKQVVLNLGRNSSKFIEEGFIRLSAHVASDSDGTETVKVFVDDSGCGIPPEKRTRLFAKFQESLDLLSQGTGIGLHLCKVLVELMNGVIFLDDDYSSGIPGHRGTRIVVDLQSGPIDPPAVALHSQGKRGNENGDEKQANVEGSCGTLYTYGMDLISMPRTELPEGLKVLFVDDDAILRKLFTRSIKLVAPDWTVREASNGETAIHLVGEEDFDLIFVDMYMASVEKQLLGTETVAELRAKGVKSRICGLSANDKEHEFLEAGSDAFLLKPMPCEANALSHALSRLLDLDSRDVDKVTADVLLPDL